jgi:hypothetical protein
VNFAAVNPVIGLNSESLVREVVEKFDHVFMDGGKDEVDSFINSDTGITVGTYMIRFFMYRKFTEQKHGVLLH